ncbi:MAG: AI-2E family transporter [Deinococcota bacterium]|nr:AI-2E family transporter [Deinococcota bacterium]
MSEVNRDEYLRRLILTLGVILLVVVFAVILWLAAEVFLYAFIGLLLAVALRAISRPLHTYLRLPDAVAVITALVVVLVLLGLFGWFYAPRVAEQAALFVESVPEALSQLEETIGGFPLGRTLLEQMPEPQDLGEGVGGDMLSQVVGTVSTTVGAIVNTVVVSFVALFLAVQPRLYRDGLIRLFPKNRRAKAAEAISISVETLRSWLLGRIISMGAVAVMVTVGLWLLGMPLAIFLGFLAGLLDFVPYLGPFVAAVPAVLLAFALSPLDALYVALLFFVVQQIESYLVTPLVQHQTVHLPPVITILAVLVMGILFGLTGIIVATPLMAVILVLVKLLYVEEVLGDHIDIKARDGA